MKCAMCDFSMEEILTVIDNGEKRIVLCPNHVVGLLLGAYSFDEVEGEVSRFTPSETCDCCSNKVIYFKESETVYKVCEEHTMKLLKKNLSPFEFKILAGIYGTDPKHAYLLHDDFYDIKGHALQPVE